MYILLSEVYLGEGEYKNYLRIIPECFDELFVLVKNDITKYITNMRDASTSKLRFTTKIFHGHAAI